MDVVKRVSAEIEKVSAIEGLKLIRPKVFPDERGFFSESYNAEEWRTKLAFGEQFVQDNHSFSKFGVVRGLHAQKGMGKLVTVAVGAIYDVAVDVRQGSPTFGKWHGVLLDAREKTFFWIPDGFLHGFQCLSEGGAHVIYKCSAAYDPKTEFGITPLDEKIGIAWPLQDKTKWIISEKDANSPKFATLSQ
ncbi:hypothetical protein niasHS_002383 [Heterodera schachtii]|uniref:dTDP-4-dehydrorhamnose 3,5-epimerase n=1 Tax=Heterodera schachtii TaxID=97005 RepID=A0ABD2KK99_HETSC